MRVKNIFKLKLVPSGEYLDLDGRLGEFVKNAKLLHFIVCSSIFFIFSVVIYVYIALIKYL